MNQSEQEARTAPYRALLHTHLSAGPAVVAVIIPAHKHTSWRSLAQLQGQRLARWCCDGLKKDLYKLNTKSSITPDNKSTKQLYLEQKSVVDVHVVHQCVFVCSGN